MGLTPDDVFETIVRDRLQQVIDLAVAQPAVQLAKPQA
jgi:hypothetical protein